MLHLKKKLKGIFKSNGNGNSDSTAALLACNKIKYKPLFPILPLKEHFYFLHQEEVVLAVLNILKPNLLRKQAFYDCFICLKNINNTYEHPGGKKKLSSSSLNALLK